MIASRLELLRGANALCARAAELRERCESGDADAWPEYRDTLATLAACLAVPETGDARGQLTTRELSERLGCSPRTVRRRKAAGKLVPVDSGGRGRSARWAVGAAR